MTLSNLTNSRLLALACIVFLLLVLAACDSGGADGTVTLPEPVGDPCDSTSVLDNGSCRQFSMRIDTRAPTPFLENGEPVELEVVLFRPLADGRYPTIMFNHGSTGNGSDPSTFEHTFTHKALAHFFVERGWMVAFPQRRGRGKSDGLYDEGFTPDRSGYSCDATLALAGADRALADLNAITDWLINRPDVDTTRMLVGGTSRGGILSIAFLAERPAVYRSAINFVGGWIGEGCGDYATINRTLFQRGASFPGVSLWLYGRNDSFYSIEHSRANFAAFGSVGGVGDFYEFDRAPGLNGHFLVNDAGLWSATVDNFLANL